MAAAFALAAGAALQAGDVTVTGSLKHEFFVGASRAAVESGAAGEPTYTELPGRFETGVNFADNYANRISGYFTPAATDSYVFFIAGDADADLFLSKDDKPVNKRLIAQQNTWGNNLEWLTAENGGKTDGADVTQKRSDQWSPDGGTTIPFAAGIALTQGTRYYIEGVHHAGGDGDNFSATFKLIADADPDNGTASTLTGAVISTLVPKGEITIAQAPAAVHTMEGRRATFTVAATATGLVKPTFQWQKNTVDIPGATAAGYTTPVLSLGDDGSFRVRVTAPGTEVSPPAVALTVARDTVAPAIVSVGALNHSGGVDVGVILDEAIANPASLALANFSLSSGTVTGATFVDE